MIRRFLKIHTVDISNHAAALHKQLPFNNGFTSLIERYNNVEVKTVFQQLYLGFEFSGSTDTVDELKVIMEDRETNFQLP